MRGSQGDGVVKKKNFKKRRGAKQMRIRRFPFATAGHSTTSEGSKKKAARRAIAPRPFPKNSLWILVYKSKGSTSRAALFHSALAPLARSRRPGVRTLSHTTSQGQDAELRSPQCAARGVLVHVTGWAAEQHPVEVYFPRYKSTCASHRTPIGCKVAFAGAARSAQGLIR